MKIHPVRYRYKADNAMGIRDGEEHIGVVAQEVQQAIPEAVTQNSKGYLLVNNDPIIWTMLNAVKEQQALIQQQRDQIKTQQAQIKAQQTLALEQQNQLKTQQMQIAELSSRMKIVQASIRTHRGSGHARLASAKGTPAPSRGEANLATASSARGGN